MNTESILKRLTALNTDAKQISLCNLAILQSNFFVKEEISIGLASPLSALVENTVEKMIIA